MKLKTLRDVTLQSYQALQKVSNPSDKDVLKTLLGYSEKDIREMKQTELDKILAHLNSQFNEEPELCSILQIKNIDFGFIPNFDDITYGENTDVSNYINDWETMHKAMAVLYRPIIHKQGGRYTIAKYNGTEEFAELMKDAPLDVVLSMIVFFYNLTKDLLKVIPSYLQKTTLTPEILSLYSAENGEGITKSLHLLKVICEDLRLLPSYPSLNV
tara:strand:+ start:6538 stop:7179 length:642 start_codon:yes stop_codon:yes gene_type:complete